jgi:hypothetical protein
MKIDKRPATLFLDRDGRNNSDGAAGQFWTFTMSNNARPNKASLELSRRADCQPQPSASGKHHRARTRAAAEICEWSDRSGRVAELLRAITTGQRLAPLHPNNLILLGILLGHLPSCRFGGGMALRRLTLVWSRAPVRGSLDAWNLGRTRTTNRSPVD